MSAILGGFFGSIFSGVIGYLFIRRNESFQKKEKIREIVAAALQVASRVFDTFHSYQPKRIYQSKLGLKLDEDFRFRINQAIKIYDEAKYLEYLLPISLRKRWDLMLILVSEYENLGRIDDIRKNRALCDVQNYIQYVRESLLDYLDEKHVRTELTRPYLQRESVENWIDDSIEI